MNKFYVIIYHPSRFASLAYLNILIFGHLNSVIDTSKTKKSITLSLTIWGYPSRFSHYTLPNTAYHCWKHCDGIRLRFHGMKYFISYHETVHFKRRNASFHPVKQTDTSPPIARELWFTRKRIRFLLHNDQQKNVIDNPKSWGIAWWIL